MDILVISCNYNKNLSEFITSFVLEQSESLKANLLILFIRKSLIDLKKFDELFEKKLIFSDLQTVSCII